MLKSYLKIAWRSIVRDKYYSIISFLGLTVGLSFFGLMLLTLNHEFSYDTGYSDSDRIYRTIAVSEQSEVQTKEAQLPLPLSDVVRDINGIQTVTKVYGMPQQVIETVHHRGRMDNMVATDEYFFDIFDLELSQGNAATALDQTMSVVITRETAQRFFGSFNPIGQTLDIEMYGLFTVTGVLKELPKNSSFRFNAIMNANIDRYLENITGRDWFRDYYTGWRGAVAHTYVKLTENADPIYASEQIQNITANYYGEAAENQHFELQPIKDVHFHSGDIQSNISELNGTPGNIQYLYIFIAISILILSIASINYMNLSSARSIKRVEEVSLRGVFGAGKAQLIAQFLTQSMLMALLSIIPAIGLLQLMIPYFEALSGIELSISMADLIKVGSFAIPSVLAIGALSGLYPAFMLSRYQLSQTVKQKTGSVQNSMFRKGLVVSQFALTYCIIVITFIAGQQLNYIFEKELGFDDEQVLVMEINDGRLRGSIPELKRQVNNHPNIVGIAGMTRIISGDREPHSIEANREGRLEGNIPASFYGFDEQVIPVLNLEVIQGRNFLAEGGESLNPTTILLNESAAALFFPNESPINQTLTLTDDETREFTVVGVVKDFHYQSLHVPIEPLVIGYINNPFVGIDDFAIRLTGNDIPGTIADLETIVGQFIELDEEVGLEAEFLQSMISAYYKTDKTYRSLFTIGAFITIVLSVIGLVGLTAFYSEMRTKEFGIRKVLGASLKDLVSIQSFFFLKLIGIAIVLGVPLSILTIQQWMKNFSYQTELGFGIYLVAAICTLVIALLPIGLISLKTSAQNPVQQLRLD